MIDNILSTITNYSPVTVIIGVVIFILRNFINDFNVTDLELKLMTPNRKFLMVLSKVIVGVIIIIVMLLFTIPDEIIRIYNESNFSEQISFVEYLTIFSIFFSFVIIMIFLLTYYFLKFIEFLIGLNYEYIISDSDGKWKVLRNNGKNNLVVKQNNLIKFITAPMDQIYEKKLVSNEFKKKIYGNEKKIIKIITTLLSIALIFLILFLLSFIIPLLFNNFLRLILFCFTIFLFITSIIIYANYKEYSTSVEPSQP